MDEQGTPQPTGAFGLLGLVQNADIVVQVVVAGLLLCSIVSWAIIFQTILRLRALRSEIGRIEAFSQNPADASSGGQLLGRLLQAIDDETAELEPAETLRARLEGAMRAVSRAELRRQEGGLPFLATLASTAPFVGLFGTVWGIMASFGSIAAAKDTSLAVVAPGIAEALFATAVGLVAAIPAVVAYNQTRAALSRCNERLLAAARTIAKVRARAVMPGQRS